MANIKNTFSSFKKNAGNKLANFKNRQKSTKIETKIFIFRFYYCSWYFWRLQYCQLSQKISQKIHQTCKSTGDSPK